MATDDFFRARLEQMIDLSHPLTVLATRMPWLEIEATLEPAFARIAFSVLLSISMICSVHAAEPGADKTVYRLYRDFGWTALFEDDGSARHYFGGSVVDQPAPVLSKYFSHDLVVLLRKEHECGVKQKGSLCKLGFDPLFASQDSAATKLLIESSSADIGLVRVNFIYPPNGEKINIKFLLKKYRNGWRFDDVIYGNMHDAALKSILGAH